MPDELTDSQIALLCEIGEFELSSAKNTGGSDFQRLLSEGYVEPSKGPSAKAAFQLTSKGADFLGKRGAGLNES